MEMAWVEISLGQPSWTTSIQRTPSVLFQGRCNIAAIVFPGRGQHFKIFKDLPTVWTVWHSQNVGFGAAAPWKPCWISTSSVPGSCKSDRIIPVRQTHAARLLWYRCSTKQIHPRKHEMANKAQVKNTRLQFPKWTSANSFKLREALPQPCLAWVYILHLIDRSHVHCPTAPVLQQPRTSLC